MIDTRLCEWLIDNAEAPIRYRVTRELLKDKQAAKKIEADMFENPTVSIWLKNLKPETPPQHRWMVHGSRDYCFENAMLKVVQLGLHAELPQVADTISYYIDIFKKNPVAKSYRTVNNQMDLLLIANLLTLADFKDELIYKFMLGSLSEIYDFVRQGDYDIYLSDKEKSELKGIPTIWREKKFIKKNLFDNGPVYPLIYDIIGLHKLYELKRLDVDEKINCIIGYITTNEFHDVVSDGYGIVICDKKKYYSMGWDPKYPGWFDISHYIESINAQKLLFFAEYISHYSIATRTRWFRELHDYLNKYKTENGTYVFPVKWFKEQQGYAIQGNHLSFGENRRKKNWIEIESTFYMQLINKNT